MKSQHDEKSLIKNDRYNTDTLFYDKAIGMNWEDAKNYYIYHKDIIKKPKSNLDMFFN